MAGENRIDLDYILVNELGQFGKYQFITIMLITFPVIFSAFSQDYIFTASSIGTRDCIFTASPNGTRCRINECDNEAPEYTPDWLLNAIPGTSMTNFDNCNRYVGVDNAATNGTCPANIFNQEQTVSCDGYVHERTNSIVYDFSIECDEWRRALVGTLNSVGTLLVLPITGYISDRYGRRVALIINALNVCWVGTLRAFSVNYEMFLILHLLHTTLGAGCYSSSFIIATELVGPKYRVVTGIFCSCLFAIGQVILGLMAWALPEWRQLTLALYVPQLFLISYFWLISESIRWYISKGKLNEAKAALLKAATVNKKEISAKSLEALFNDAPVVIVDKEENKPKEPSLVMKIINSPVMLKRVCTTPVWWVTTTLTFYGLSINSTSLAGNMYINYILVAAIEIPGYWLAVFLLTKVGRRRTLFWGYLLCAACQFGFIFMPESLPSLTLVIYMVGKMSISAVLTSLYIYTAELYPTSNRHSLLAFSSMIGRIGSISAPLTPALMIYWHGIPSLMFGAMAFISACLVLTTPETLGAKLPDTIEEAEAIGRKK